MRNEVPRLAATLQAQAVYTNHDYEPGAVERDLAEQRALLTHGIALRTFKDQVVFDKDELLTREVAHSAVFTAHRKAWLERLAIAYPVEKYAASLARSPAGHVPTLEELGSSVAMWRPITEGGTGWLPPDAMRSHTSGSSIP